MLVRLHLRGALWQDGISLRWCWYNDAACVAHQLLTPNPGPGPSTNPKLNPDQVRRAPAAHGRPPGRTLRSALRAAQRPLRRLPLATAAQLQQAARAASCLGRCISWKGHNTGQRHKGRRRCKWRFVRCGRRATSLPRACRARVDGIPGTSLPRWPRRVRRPNPNPNPNLNPNPNPNLDPNPNPYQASLKTTGMTWVARTLRASARDPRLGTPTPFRASPSVRASRH